VRVETPWRLNSTTFWAHFFSFWTTYLQKSLFRHSLRYLRVAPRSSPVHLESVGSWGTRFSSGESRLSLWSLDNGAKTTWNGRFPTKFRCLGALYGPYRLLHGPVRYAWDGCVTVAPDTRAGGYVWALETSIMGAKTAPMGAEICGEMRYDAPRLTILADRGDLWRYGYLHCTIHESGASNWTRYWT